MNDASLSLSLFWQNSITSEWSGTWLVLRKSQRRLIFVSEATGNVEKMDLRKARCIGEWLIYNRKGGGRENGL